MKTIRMLNEGRFISDHGRGVKCYFDHRHQLIHTRLSGGGFAELIKALQPDGSYRNEFLVMVSADHARLVIELSPN